jgi:hypothetical protein
VLVLAHVLEGIANVAREVAVEARETDRVQVRDRMRRMIAVWKGLRFEDGAPYPDARLLLTFWILRHGAVVALQDKTKRAERARICAEVSATVVGQVYPALAARMAEPERIDRIRAAIQSATTTTNRKPWRLIARCWAGIEASDPSAEVWRVKWAEHQAARTEP